MDFKKLNYTPGFTLLELLIVLILIGITSTIVVTNTSFLDQYESDETASYREFIHFLSEESALTRKIIAWFISNNTQSVGYLKNNQWKIKDEEFSYYPVINSSTIFKDSQGNSFTFSDDRKAPFLIFYPSGQSSGGTIQINESDFKLTLRVDTFGQVID